MIKASVNSLRSYLPVDDHLKVSHLNYLKSVKSMRAEKVHKRELIKLPMGGNLVEMALTGIKLEKSSSISKQEYLDKLEAKSFEDSPVNKEKQFEDVKVCVGGKEYVIEEYRKNQLKDNDPAEIPFAEDFIDQVTGPFEKAKLHYILFIVV